MLSAQPFKKKQSHRTFDLKYWALSYRILTHLYSTSSLHHHVVSTEFSPTIATVPLPYSLPTHHHVVSERVLHERVQLVRLHVRRRRVHDLYFLFI